MNVPTILENMLKPPMSQQTSPAFQDVFNVTLVFQDLLMTSSRRLQDVFAIRLLQNVLKTSSKTSARRLQYFFIKTNVCWGNS